MRGLRWSEPSHDGLFTSCDDGGVVDHRIDMRYATARCPLGWPALAVRMSIHRTFCCSCARARIPSRAQVLMRCKTVRAFARRVGLTGASTSTPDMLLMGASLAHHPPARASALLACGHLSLAPVSAHNLILSTPRSARSVACLAFAPSDRFFGRLAHDRSASSHSLRPS